jgi:hypothetical protein
MRSTNLNHLERWISPGKVQEISDGMRGWYGPPIAVGVPGAVYATPDGDFVGKVSMGSEATWLDYAEDFVRRMNRRVGIMTRDKRLIASVGFQSISDIINAVTSNQYRQQMDIYKVGVTGAANSTNTLWYSGSTPQAGGNASAAAAGRAPTSSTTGAVNWLVNGSTWTGAANLYITSAFATSSVASNTLMMYDRLFDVAKTMSSTGTESVTGTLTRYNNTSTSTDPQYAAGNFLFVEVGTAALGSGAHNWTLTTYKNQANSSQTAPDLTGNSAGIAQRIDHPAGQWFMPLAAGDTGISALTQMKCSASITASGGLNFVIGRPLIWMPTLQANQMYVMDGINTTFSLVRVIDSACLAFLEVTKPSTSAATYNASILTAAG